MINLGLYIQQVGSGNLSTYMPYKRKVLQIDYGQDQCQRFPRHERRHGGQRMAQVVK